MDEVKNNREYDTLSKEIEYQTLEIELCNKKIKEAAFKIEDKKVELAQNQEIIEDRRQALEVKKNELDEIMEETRAEEDKLKQKVKELEMKIEPRLLTSFKRIRKNARNGLGIVYVQRDACGGSVMLAVVASTRFHPSVSWISRCTRRSSFASIAVVS